ncbi:hypothetical protein [Dickeya undicola]|uniref:hypothetical protein n=1 Tax=Dickeya undicola TaxID=1577887 RepID=UPI0011CE9AB9|nr:hypothetical protein [Dickeya undicola]
MSDEISILTHVSEENPTTARLSASTESGFSAVTRQPHAIPIQASSSFTSLRHVAQATALISTLWRTARDTRKPWLLFILTRLQPDFANAKVVLGSITLTASFSGLIATCSLSERYRHSGIVNGCSDFNLKFGNSNRSYILRSLTRTDGLNGKRA